MTGRSIPEIAAALRAERRRRRSRWRLQAELERALLDGPVYVPVQPSDVDAESWSFPAAPSPDGELRLPAWSDASEFEATGAADAFELYGIAGPSGWQAIHQLGDIGIEILDAGHAVDATTVHRLSSGIVVGERTNDWQLSRRVDLQPWTTSIDDAGLVRIATGLTAGLNAVYPVMIVGEDYEPQPILVLEANTARVRPDGLAGDFRDQLRMTCDDADLAVGNDAYAVMSASGAFLERVRSVTQPIRRPEWSQWRGR